MQQTHPLYDQDRRSIDQLLAAASPGPLELTDAARLLIRYRGFPGCADLQADLATALKRWGLDEAALQQRSRAIWASGWRPSPAAEEAAVAVGSGADVNS